MVDFRPFPALRYSPSAGELSDLISPPYDVLSPAEVDEVADRSPYNIIRLEHPQVALRTEQEPYKAAARLLAEWKSKSILRTDASAFYVDEHQFQENGQTRRRLVLYGRLKLSPWEEGQILPHEYTMAGPKEDRLRLMSALKANISPLYLLYDDPDGRITSLVNRSEELGAVASATAQGQRHLLRMIQDPVLVESLHRLFERRRLYMADGHHRYETALAYHEKTGRPGSDYVLVGLTAGSDPGLSIHATHRIYSGQVDEDRIRQGIEEDFLTRSVQPEELEHALSGGEVVLGLAGLDGVTSLIELRPRDLAKLSSRTPGEGPQLWRELDVNILQHVVLGGYLGLDPLEPNQPGLGYVHSMDEALAAVSTGEAKIALLLRPVTPHVLFAVSDAGVRLPQKTTYFYPKLPTGLVMNLFDQP